jgi:hypothetical protein
MMLVGDDSFGGIIEPMVVLPDQMQRRARCGARESSAHRLMLGILEDAVHLFPKARDPRSRLTKRQRRELIAWFASSDRRWLFSFERICEALDIDADSLRRRIGVHAGSDDAIFARIQSSVSVGAPPVRSGGLTGPHARADMADASQQPL